MPTILRWRGCRFFFFSNEGSEPPHIHVESGDDYAKFWLEPVELDRSLGFNTALLRRLHWIVEENQSLFLERWHEHFKR